MPAPQSPSVHHMRTLLSEVTEHFARQRYDSWRQAYGRSRARTEATETAGCYRRDGVTSWGAAPLEVVWRASQLQYIAVLEHVRAAAALLVPPFGRGRWGRRSA